MENLEKVGAWTISFGKHKNEQYQSIIEKDPKYAQWLSGIHNSDKVKEYLKSKLTKEST